MGITFLWGAGQVLRDVHWISALCFYIPSAALVAMLLGGACLIRGTRLGLRRALLLVLLIAPLVFEITVENHGGGRSVAPEPGQPVYRLAHWNVFSARLGWASIRERLAATKADIFVLTEVRDVPLEELRDEMGADYRLTVFADLAVLARGELTGGEWLNRSKKLKVHHLTWHVDGHELSVIAADVGSNPLLPRDPQLRKLVAFMREREADLVAGDLNSPRRSLALDPLPVGYRHAHEAVGESRWSYTWPLPLPVLAIDHCMTGPRIRPLEYTLGVDLVSDHRLQLLDFQVERPAEKPAEKPERKTRS